ncbi:MAG: branched-chain amino acid transport system permease protein [Frankiaceae bacterium]|nr:branched-chain amino acid transport system permease protein [Frankiaceae bacterium]
MSTRLSTLASRWDTGVVVRASNTWSRTSGRGRAIVYTLALLFFLLVVPSGPIATFMAPGSDWRTILFFPIGMFVLLALGLNVVVGYAGLLDLGFVAFFAIGAYTMGILGHDHHWNFWQVLPVGVALAMGAGVLLGSPTLRLRGDYLAIVTLGFGEIVRVTANNLDDFTGGPRGVSSIPHPPSIDSVKIGDSRPFHYGVLDARPYYYLIVIVIVIVIVAAKRLERSRVGRSWAAIREDEDAAELMGVPTLKFKLWAFAIGAAIAGAGGVFYAGQASAISPPNFSFEVSVMILAAVVLGGSGNIPGVILGAFLVAWLPERFRGFTQYRFLIFGALLVVLMIYRPQGLLPSRRRRAELVEGGGGGMGRMGGDVGSAEQRREVDE